MKMFLDTEELRELTGRTRCDAQVKRLHEMEIVFHLRDDKPVVLREHILNKFGIEMKPIKVPVPFKFNWNHASA